MRCPPTGVAVSRSITAKSTMADVQRHVHTQAPVRYCAPALLLVTQFQRPMLVHALTISVLLPMAGAVKRAHSWATTRLAARALMPDTFLHQIVRLAMLLTTAHSITAGASRYASTLGRRSSSASATQDTISHRVTSRRAFPHQTSRLARHRRQQPYSGARLAEVDC